MVAWQALSETDGRKQSNCTGGERLQQATNRVLGGTPTPDLILRVSAPGRRDPERPLMTATFRHSLFMTRLGCRRHLNIRGKSANLPAITERDWLDIKFGVDVGVDYYALSFVRNADVIYELKRWLSQQGAPPLLKSLWES